MSQRDAERVSPTAAPQYLYLLDEDLYRRGKVLEALQSLDVKWTAIRDAAAGAADYGNDMMRLSILREGSEAKAVEAFANNRQIVGRTFAPVLYRRRRMRFPAYCLAITRFLILLYVAVGTIFFVTSSFFPL